MNLRILNTVLCVILVNVLGNCVSGSCSQNGDGIIENSSNNTSENVDNMSQRAPLTFGPETLNKLKVNQDFIAAYGSIPTFTTSEERDKWIDKLVVITQQVSGNFDQEMSKYFYPKGPVTGFGVTIDGVIQVGINKSQIVDKPFLDGIYQIFDSKANRMGIKEVPVVFVHEDNFIPASGAKSPELNLSSINNDSNGKNSGGNKTSKINSVPGFELLVSLLCLCGSWKLKKY